MIIDNDILIEMIEEHFKSLGHTLNHINFKIDEVMIRPKSPIDPEKLLIKYQLIIPPSKGSTNLIGINKEKYLRRLNNKILNERNKKIDNVLNGNKLSKRNIKNIFKRTSR